MKKNKERIDIYTNLYGVDLVVANLYAKLEKLLKQYKYCNDNELDSSILDSAATTARCIRKSDNKPCILVKYNRNILVKGIDKYLDTINTITHEAGHVALDIYEYIDQDVCFCTSEPFCYLLGWAGECICKTLKNK